MRSAVKINIGNMFLRFSKPCMRYILIDWLVDVHRFLRIETLSLYLTVNILDRFLRKSQLAHSTLQLVGVTALSMTYKYEESFTSRYKKHYLLLAGLVTVTEGNCSRKEVITMEALILNCLGFRLKVATQLPFLKHNLRAVSQAQGHDERVDYFAHYAIELALCDYKMLRQRCRSCAYYARYPTASSTLGQYSGVPL